MKRLCAIMCWYSIIIISLTPSIAWTKKNSHPKNKFSLAHAKNQTIITVIGTGYVGLVTGSCLAEFGNYVICADIDNQKINMLHNGVIPIYEPGLSEVVTRNLDSGRLMFTSNINAAIKNADVIFIAVGTPMDDDGSADLKAVETVIQTIAKNMNKYKVIVTKSTVPIGTGKKIEELMLKNNIHVKQFDIVSNPEFLREGCAVNDFLHPDRLVIGAESDNALAIMCKIYEPLINNKTPYVFTNIVSAETIKYAANAFLSTKLSFINEIANLCDQTGADVQTVGFAMGLDHRISPYFLKPGPGFGGSCFPKDTQALLYMAKQHDVPLHTVQAALETNKLQQLIPFKKLKKLMNKSTTGTDLLTNKTIAVLGLAFKSNTDDIRYSPAITTIASLIKEGARVKTYDPAAMENMQQLFPSITYCTSLYEAVTNADAIIIMTEWDEFKQMDLSKIAKLVKGKYIVDARNILNPLHLQELGFECDTIGQSCLCTTKKRHHKRFIPMHLYKMIAIN